ncbi:DUF5753 domain-containing protein [Amycolatopsis azurea]|uniref:DUF5753 domain-containing protein n=1 Tax=Amycolatopsis azurea TaxID=36819 RepID=UPI003803AA73
MIADSTGWNVGKPGRMINGRMGASRLDVGKFLIAAKASPDEIDRLSTLAALSPRAYSIQAHPAGLPDLLPTLRFLDATAASITSYDPHQLPHLAQTSGYTDIMLRGTGLLTDGAVADGAAARQERHTVLSGHTGPIVRSYIREHVLRRALPVPVAAGQRRHLHNMVLHPRHHLRIVPASAPLTAVPAFTLFRDSQGNEVVTVSTPTALLVLDDAGPLATYRRAIAQLTAAALPGAESTARVLAPDTFDGETTC